MIVVGIAFFSFYVNGEYVKSEVGLYSQVRAPRTRFALTGAPVR